MILNKKVWNILSGIMMALLLFFFINILYAMMKTSPENIPNVRIISITFDLFGILIGFMLYICLLLDRMEMNFRKRVFTTMIFTISSVLYFDATAWIVDGRAQYITLSYFSNFMTYLSMLLTLFLFREYIYSQIEEKLNYNSLSNRVFQSIIILDIIILVLNLKFKFMYSIDANATYHRESYVWFAYVGVTILLAIIVNGILRSHQDKKTKFRLCIFTVTPFVFNMLQHYTFGISIFYIMFLCNLLLIYITVYLSRGYEIALQREELAKLDRDLTRYRTRLMLSSMQPHFLYNTLSTIDVLIDLDPKTASTALEKFTAYLRVNLDSIDHTSLITFKKEMEHVSNYLYLEKMRYEDIRINIDTMDSMDFRIPPLTIQPVVENAVRHGLLEQEDGGTITIAEHEREDCHEIIIKDNGMGFNLETLESNDNLNGIKIAEERLKNLCNGSMEIATDTGIGTLVVIRIPKEGE